MSLVDIKVGQKFKITKLPEDKVAKMRLITMGLLLDRELYCGAKIMGNVLVCKDGMGKIGLSYKVASEIEVELI
jgi:Fe2+ transport system protein FeoA